RSSSSRTGFGRGRLPTCVVRMRSLLCNIGSDRSYTLAASRKNPGLPLLSYNAALASRSRDDTRAQETPMSRTAPASLTHKTIFASAVPVMISNVTTPLLGVVDTGVVGRIPDPAYIGAVAIGALIFTFVFWAFGFLRMGTTGLTAQAHGAGDAGEVLAVLGRALLIAAAAGGAIILLERPIGAAAFAILDGSERVESLARDYFQIRIWAAPVTLVNYALLGWFIGLGRTDLGLVLQLLLNVTNIALDVLFVLGFGWDVRGVALGTLLAETAAAAAGLAIAWREAPRLGGRLSLDRVLIPARLKRTFMVNVDIMVRTLALLAVFVWFNAESARQG